MDPRAPEPEKVRVTARLRIVEEVLPDPRMHRRITGFHQDDEGHWVAELECGHRQHVRHDPPWQLREWVMREVSRQQRVGTSLDCRLCESG